MIGAGVEHRLAQHEAIWPATQRQIVYLGVGAAIKVAVAAQQGKQFWIGFEGDDPTGRADEAGEEHGVETEVAAYIEHGHAGSHELGKRDAFIGAHVAEAMQTQVEPALKGGRGHALVPDGIYTLPDTEVVETGSGAFDRVGENV